MCLVATDPEGLAPSHPDITPPPARRSPPPELGRARNGDPSPIVKRFADAAFAAIVNGRQLAQDLVAVYDSWGESITARKSASVWRVLPLLLSQPAVTSKLVQEAIGISQPAADNVISQLRDAGIVTKAAGGQRYLVWVAGDVTKALDDFADRARRRHTS